MVELRWNTTEWMKADALHVAWRQCFFYSSRCRPIRAKLIRHRNLGSRTLSRCEHGPGTRLTWCSTMPMLGIWRHWSVTCYECACSYAGAASRDPKCCPDQKEDAKLAIFVRPGHQDADAHTEPHLGRIAAKLCCQVEQHSPVRHSPHAALGKH